MKIVIDIQGGCLQAVYAPEGCTVELFDWDNIASDGHDESVEDAELRYNREISTLTLVF